MKAWILDSPGGAFNLKDVPIPKAGSGTVVVKLEAVPLLSYMRSYIDGKLPYFYPQRPFTPGTNGIGRIIEVGPEVYGMSVGQRVAVNPYLIANEPSAEPNEILMGLTGITSNSGALLDRWASGTLREYCCVPASTVVPLTGLDDLPAEHLATLAKFIVPFGGLRRGRLMAGETLIVNGATGYFGSAAVLLGQTLGASEIVAVGRNVESLATLKGKIGNQVRAVALSGNTEVDLKQLRGQGNGIDMAFDMVGQAADSAGTLTALRALRRNGRLVLMGSMTVPLPVPYGEMLLNNWEIIGHFMYSAEDYRRLIALVASSQLDLSMIPVKVFALDQLVLAMDAASVMRSLDCVSILMK